MPAPPPLVLIRTGTYVATSIKMRSLKPTLIARLRKACLRFIHNRYPPKARNNYCSFCGRSYCEACPFAEGEFGAMICGDCAKKSSEIIADRIAQLTAKPTAEENISNPTR